MSTTGLWNPGWGRDTWINPEHVAAIIKAQREDFSGYDTCVVLAGGTEVILPDMTPEQAAGSLHEFCASEAEKQRDLLRQEKRRAAYGSALDTRSLACP